MIVFASIFGRFWTDFGTQNRWKIDAQSDAKSSIEKSRAQKGQEPPNRGLNTPRNLRSEAPGRGKGGGKPFPEGMEGFLEDVISKPPVAQRAGGISSLRFPFDVQH